MFLFDEDGRMFVLPEPAVADELLDTAEEVYEGFDGRARTLVAAGEPGAVYLVVASDQPQEALLRARICYYYARFVTRSPPPPPEADLTAYVNAVADDEIIE
ncbi:hypothetical protein [Streptomyces sp. TR06-5]|uniref:hypothetical protein n=1 Tax=Streptomyces sp. TR06-5 TaxID=3385976 RepID=UPI0039A1A4D1